MKFILALCLWISFIIIRFLEKKRNIYTQSIIGSIILDILMFVFAILLMIIF